jgi:hypothetical protein
MINSERIKHFSQDIDRMSIDQKPDIAIIDAAVYTFLAIEKALKPKQHIDSLTVLSTKYYEFADVFSRKDADTLPPHRPYDYRIELKEDSKPPISRLYPMSRDELLVLRKYLEDHL